MREITRFLNRKTAGDFVEILDLTLIFDTCRSSLKGRYLAGEELQEPMDFDK